MYASFEEFLKASIPTREAVQWFLDANHPSWAQFDSELGYVLSSCLIPNIGISGSTTISTVQANGARKMINYAERPCRINTYGDSFTEGHQVNDGETWQEYLAAHLGEPVRNFGVGGYGAYQAYLRLLRIEASEDAVENILFYIWGDDHHRSVMRCRFFAFSNWFDIQQGRIFHGNYWSHLEMNLDTGQFVEKEAQVQKPQELINITKPDFVLQTLRKDMMLELYAYCDGLIPTVDVTRFNSLAEALGLHALSTGESLSLQKAVQVRDQYALQSTGIVLNKLIDFCSQHHKKLMVLLFDPGRVLPALVEGKPRYDQPVIDYLQHQKVDYFDMNEVHYLDFQGFNLPYREYVKRYFVGHYSPAGNHFFAFSLKDKLVNWLEPKPITYQNSDLKLIDFSGYLH